MEDDGLWEFLFGAGWVGVFLVVLGVSLAIAPLFIWSHLREINRNVRVLVGIGERIDGRLRDLKIEVGGGAGEGAKSDGPPAGEADGPSAFVM